MTKKKIGTVDPVAIRELISQGISMERKESEMKSSQEEKQEKSEFPDDAPIARDFVKSQKREKRMVAKGDYESLFICRNTLKNLHHLETYKDEINRLAEMKFKKLLSIPIFRCFKWNCFSPCRIALQHRRVSLLRYGKHPTSRMLPKIESRDRNLSLSADTRAKSCED